MKTLLELLLYQVRKRTNFKTKLDLRYRDTLIIFIIHIV